MTPSVAVVIPAHGHPGLVRACVQSILRAPTRPAEILVVDDSSPEPIKPEDAEGARLMRTESNLGFAGACNLGATCTTSDVIIFLNSDTEVAGDWIGDLLGCMEPDVAIVGGRLLYRDGTTQHAGIIFSQEDGAPRHAYRGFPGDHPAVLRTRDMQAVTGACLLVRRSDFLPDGFDEEYENGFEDVDLCLRMRDAGRRVVYCGTTEIVHLESVSIRDAPTGPNRHSANRARFEQQWSKRIEPDEFSMYANDGLLRIRSHDVYPLSVWIAPELGVSESDGTSAEVAGLLNVRSQQVFDLEKEIGSLTTQLLDHGILPSE